MYYFFIYIGKPSPPVHDYFLFLNNSLIDIHSCEMRARGWLQVQLNKHTLVREELGELRQV